MPSTIPQRGTINTQPKPSRRLLELLSDEKKTHDIVLDRSFWAREDRGKFKRLTEEKNGRRVFVYLKAG